MLGADIDGSESGGGATEGGCGEEDGRVEASGLGGG